jgi:hypothetical protein
LLAFPGDILPAKAVDYDPEDYMMGEKYSRKSFTTGPVSGHYLKLSSVSIILIQAIFNWSVLENFRTK